MRSTLFFALTAFFLMLNITESKACDGSGFIMNNLTDNGDGTWTLEMTIYVAGTDWVGGILGGTTGFNFSTDAANILSFSPASLTSLNGTTLNAVTSGNTISWGDPDSGPFFVAASELTQTFPMTLTLSEEPSQWSGGGMELNGCPGGPGTSTPSPGYSGVFNNFTPPELCENFPDLAVNDNSTATDAITLSSATAPIGSSTTIDAVCVLIEHTYIGDLTLTLTSPEGTIITLSSNNGGGGNDYGDVGGGNYMCFTPDALFDINDIIPGTPGAYQPEDPLSDLDGEDPNGTWTLSVTDGVGGDSGTLLAWGIAFSEGICNCAPPTVELPEIDPSCDGESITITATGEEVDTYEWSTGDFGETVTVFPVDGETITVTASNVCGDVSASLDVTVNSPPQLDPIDDQVICEGETLTVFASGQDIDTYTWSTGEMNDEIEIVGSETETISVVVSNECGEASDDFTVFVDPLPTVDGDNFYNICEGESVTLSVNTEFTTDILWTTGDEGEQTTITPTESDVYFVQVSNECGWEEFEVVVDVQPALLLAWVSADQTICPGQTAILEINVENEDLVEWSEPNFGNVLEVSPDVTTTYSVTAEGFCGMETLMAEVTVTEPYFSDLLLQACEGSTVNYENTNLLPGDMIDFTLTAIDGCDSIVTVMVEELSISSNTLELFACPNGTVSYDGVDLSVGENQDFIFLNDVMCDSIVTVFVSPLPSFSSSLELSTCAGGFVTYQNAMMAPGDTLDFTLMAQNGCDSVVTVSVVAEVAPEYMVEFPLCPGSTLQYENDTLNIGDNSTYNLLDQAGCDSIVHVNVVALPTFTSSLQLSTCEGGFVTYQNTMMIPGDTLGFTLTAQNGCDSVVTVNVIADDPPEFNLEIPVCPGTSITYEGQIFDIGGAQSFTLQDQAGCDSIVHLSVVALPTFNSDLMLSACTGESVNYASTDLLAGSMQDFTLTAQNGCDSVVTVMVTALATYQMNEEYFVCPGETINYADSTLSAGTLQDFPFTTVDGCDSIVAVMVTELPTFTSSLNLQTCEGNNVFYAGQEFLPNSVQDVTLTAINGCDSVVTVTVIEVNNLETDLPLSICPGSSIEYDGVTLAIGDNQDFLYMTAQGCDSTVHVSVEALPVFSETVTLQTCENETVAYDGVNLSAGALQDFTFMAQNGCDSVVTVMVEALPVFAHDLELFSCPDESVAYAGEMLLPGSIQDVSFVTTEGCDSIVTVMVTALPDYASELELFSCPDESVTYGGSTLLPGTIQDFNLVAQNGCDSIVTVTVTPLPVFNSTLEFDICPDETVVYEGTTLSPGDIQSFILVAENGCDSTVLVTVEALPTFESDLVLQTCEGSSIVYSGQTLNAGDQQDFILVAENGCDSTVHVAVVALPVYAQTLNVEACDGASYNFNGTMIPAGQEQTFNYLTQDGCDSIIMVNVAEVAHINTFGTASICSGESIVLFNETVSQAGVYSGTVASSQGCDSTHHITLEILPLPTPNYSAEASCVDDNTGEITLSTNGGVAPFTYLWEDNFSGEVRPDLLPGDYQITVTDAVGCTQTLTATVPAHTLQFSTMWEDITCYGLDDGFVTASSATPNVLYSLDGNSFGTSGLFSGLTAGEYTLYAEDTYGCIYESPSFNIIEPSELIVQLPPDTVIKLSESIYIPALSNRPFNTIFYHWTPSDGLDCTDCFRPLATPLATTSYDVLVIDENGCTATDDITIFVDRRRSVYIPSGFSPNGDGINDIFHIYSDPSVKSIHTFMVFNRWGESVFEVYDSLPNNPQWGWDGLFRGEPLNPAVFAYFAIIEFVDGEIELFKGDVTLTK